jgi:polysaccharide export outer membrane protein
LFNVLSIFLLIAVGASIVAGCGSSQEASGVIPPQVVRSEPQPLPLELQADTYVIRQGDQIQLSVWGYPEFNQTGIVKETGTFSIPLLGEQAAAGLTKEAFTAQVQKILSEYVQGEAKITINVISTVAQRVSVIGAVLKQDTYVATSDVSLVQILSNAGGTTADADLRRVRIVRSGAKGQPIEVDLLSYFENGSIDSAPVVRPGDTVFVPRQEDLIIKLSQYLGSAVLLVSFVVFFK